MNFEEKQINAEYKYKGRIINMRVDDIILPDGNPAFREYCKHIGAVCVLPLTENNEVVCVRQYRYAHSKVMLEIPAGKLDSHSEDFIEATLRELREETGAVCRELTHIATFYPSPAILGEKIEIFLARGLSFGETSLDEDEFLEVQKYDLEELIDMILSGEITDSKTIAAILAYKEKYITRK